MWRTGFQAACLLAVLPAAVLAAGPRTGGVSSRPLATLDPMHVRQRPETPPQGSAANRWRYSFHNGHWWYYRDGGHWAYWNGTQWLGYEPKSYQRWYLKEKMAEYNAELARFDAQTMAPYMAGSFQNDLLRGGPVYLGRQPYSVSPWPQSSGAGVGLFTPRPYNGRLNPATSVGGYMGGALRGPSGY
ncbi:MAG TPA: hypothetical protein VNH11_32945 [Pirellulales bacterium]|nr:hypothetical protein [Pirellulales bacterium]